MVHIEIGNIDVLPLPEGEELMPRNLDEEIKRSRPVGPLVEMDSPAGEVLESGGVIARWNRLGKVYEIDHGTTPPTKI